MIRGIGIDIIEIHRIEKAHNKNPRFLNRILTDREIAYIEKNRKPVATLAGYFAAKEAVSKALGTGFRGFSFTDIEVHKDEMNRPSVSLYNNAKAQLESMGATEVWISISHSKTNAVAQAVITKGGLKDG